MKDKTNGIPNRWRATPGLGRRCVRAAGSLAILLYTEPYKSRFTKHEREIQVTRHLAKEIINSELVTYGTGEFEKYANDGEAFEGAEFWRGFESPDELVDDFRLFVTASDVRLVAC
jgi:hypothetical protein